MLSQTNKSQRHQALSEQQKYPTWKAEAAKELKNRHNIEATAIAERIWTQFFVHQLGPIQAADRAEMVFRRTHPPDWIKRRR